MICNVHQARQDSGNSSPGYLPQPPSSCRNRDPILLGSPGVPLSPVFCSRLPSSTEGAASDLRWLNWATKTSHSPNPWLGFGYLLVELCACNPPPSPLSPPQLESLNLWPESLTAPKPGAQRLENDGLCHHPLRWRPEP